MEIQVEFEGRNPIDPDFDGIKTLLQQLFLKSYTNLDNLTNLIIAQNFIGSVIKQSTDGLEREEDEDDIEDDINDVFGITTAINISDDNIAPCIQQIRKQLSELSQDHASPETKSVVENLLKNNSSKLGLLINERFINIPPQISIPLLNNLVHELERAASKKMPFDFAHYVLICKMYKPKSKKKNTKKTDNESEIVWSNPEEEIFAEMCDISFEFPVDKKFDTALSGEWSEEDEKLTPYRRVLIFEASKLPRIIDEIKNNVPELQLTHPH